MTTTVVDSCWETAVGNSRAHKNLQNLCNIMTVTMAALYDDDDNSSNSSSDDD